MARNRGWALANSQKGTDAFNLTPFEEIDLADNHVNELESTSFPTWLELSGEVAAPPDSLAAIS